MLRKTKYRLIIIGGGILAALLGLIGVILVIYGAEASVFSPLIYGMILIIIGIVVGIIAFVFYMILIYKIWEAIQSKKVRTTPGKAVGFMFIPFFNLYWNFQVYYGFALDYNEYIKDNNLDMPKFPKEFVLVLPILMILAGFTSYFGVLILIAIYILQIIFIVKATYILEKLPIKNEEIIKEAILKSRELTKENNE